MSDCSLSPRAPPPPCVERQQVGLKCNGVDYADEVRNFARGCFERLHRFHRARRDVGRLLGAFAGLLDHGIDRRVETGAQPFVIRAEGRLRQILYLGDLFRTNLNRKTREIPRVLLCLAFSLGRAGPCQFAADRCQSCVQIVRAGLPALPWGRWSWWHWAMPIPVGSAVFGNPSQRSGTAVRWQCSVSQENSALRESASNPMARNPRRCP